LLGRIHRRMSEDLREVKAQGSIGRYEALCAMAARLAGRGKAQEPTLNVRDRAVRFRWVYWAAAQSGRSPDENDRDGRSDQRQVGSDKRKTLGHLQAGATLRRVQPQERRRVIEGPTKPRRLISRERNIALKRKMAMHALG